MLVKSNIGCRLKERKLAYRVTKPKKRTTKTKTKTRTKTKTGRMYFDRGELFLSFVFCGV